MANASQKVCEEVLEALKVAEELRGKGLNQAAMQGALKSIKNWSHIEPVSVGDDYSLVIKVDGLRPCRADDVKGLGELLEPIRNFQLVLKVGEGYIAVGHRSLRVSLSAPKEQLMKVIERCLR
ncbi:MAG: hypothetical protein QXW94_06645 [Desulfurococcaceae archaeon]